MNNSVNNKRITKNTTMLYVRMLLIMAITLYTSRVVLQVLGVEDYGIYNVVGGIVYMLGFLNGALGAATQRYLNFEMGKNNIDGMRKVFSISFWCFLLIAVVIVILGETIGLWFLNTKLDIPPERMPAAVWVYQLSIISFFINIVMIPYNATIIAHEKMSIYAYISIGEAICKLGLVYLLLVISCDKLVLYSFLTLIVTIIISAIYWITCKVQFEECKVSLIWDRNLFKGLFSFSGWMLAGITTNILSTQGINILINIFFGPILNTARAIALQVQNAVNLFVTNFMTAIRPQVVKSYAQEDYDYMYKLVFSASRISFYLLLILSLPIIINTYGILNLWLGEVPDYSVSFTRLALIDVLITTSYNPIAYANQASGNIKLYQSVISLGFVLIFLFAWGLYLLGFSAETSFYAAIVIDIIGLFARLITLNKVMKFPVKFYLLKVSFRLLKVFVLVCLASFLLNIIIPVDSIIPLLLNSFISVVLTLMCIWLIGLEMNEKEMITIYIHKCLPKRNK